MKTAPENRRHESTGHLLDIRVERRWGAPIARQLYQALRSAIVSGRLSAGVRLPSTRFAARLWRVSRGAIVEAYESLLSEGYVVGKSGSGTFVSDDVPERTQIGSADRKSVGPTAISKAAAQTLASRLLDPPPQLAFAMGRATIDAKTMSVLKRIGQRHLGMLVDHYRDQQGEASLRQCIAAYLAATRGVVCNPTQIFITAGSQQGIDLAIRTLIDPGDTVAMEDPSYPPARLALAAHGAQIASVAIDDNGIDVAQLTKSSARAVYLTPSHQYPTGTVLPMARRLAVIDWAHATNAWIFEDDYDSEFRYGAPPLAALHGIDQHGRTIYIGTFSKALLPGLRLGYLVVPEELAPAFRGMRVLLDRFPAPFHQLVIADFLAEGHFSSHLRRLRDTYQRSRDLLVDLLRARVADHLTVQHPGQGVHLLAEIHAGFDDVTAANAARRSGVTVLPVSPMSMQHTNRRGLLMGFSGLNEVEADAGTKRLRTAFRRLGT